MLSTAVLPNTVLLVGHHLFYSLDSPSLLVEFSALTVGLVCSLLHQPGVYGAPYVLHPAIMCWIVSGASWFLPGTDPSLFCSLV